MSKSIKDSEWAEEALRKSEAKLREAQRIGRLGSWDWDALTDTITWSKEYYRIYGFDPKQRPPGYGEHLKAYTPESAARLDVAVKKTMQTGEPYELDLELSNPTGPTKWISARGEARRDADGRIAGLRGTAQDITERVEAEKMQKLLSSYNRSLIEASPDALVTIGPDGKITDVNSSTETVTGYPREKLIGTDFSDYFTEPEKARFGYQQVFRKGVVHDYELEIRHRDGHVTPVFYNASVYRDETGDVVGVFAAARDITERKRAEDALKLSEERLTKAQNMAHVGNWEWNVVENTLYWSDEVYRMYGRDPVLYTPAFESVKEAMHPDDRQPFVEAVNAALYEQKPFEMDYRLIRPDGTERTLHTIGEVLRDPAGKPLIKRGTVQDITERKQAEEALRSAYHKLESSLEENRVLLSEVQHRVKNNLQTIISLFKLQATWTEDKPIVEILNENQNRIRAMALVHEKLSQTKDFAHIHYGSYIRDLASALLSAHALTAPGVALELDVDDVSLGIDTAMHLGLIINELITNSLKHAFPNSRGGVISITLKKLESVEDLHELVVRDNGIGIPDSIDFRETRTMGLYLVTNLAETQLRGRIELIRHQGTEFRIRFRGV